MRLSVVAILLDKAATNRDRASYWIELNVCQQQHEQKGFCVVMSGYKQVDVSSCKGVDVFIHLSCSALD